MIKLFLSFIDVLAYMFLRGRFLSNSLNNKFSTNCIFFLGNSGGNIHLLLFFSFVVFFIKLKGTIYTM